MLLPTAGHASREPVPGGLTSSNVEHVAHIPLEAGTATGMRIVGRHLYVTSWKSFSIYDVSDPLSPRRLSTTPFGFAFENEDVATNGKILLFSEELPRNVLHVWDVEDKTQPVEIATLAGGGGHTQSCVLGCRYAYGATGVIVDLRDPAHPEIVGNWKDAGETRIVHDVTEIAPGMVLTSGMQLLDARRDPTSPRLVAAGHDPENPHGLHSVAWPNAGRDRFILGSNESLASGRCENSTGNFSVWETKGYQRTRTFTIVDTWNLANGTHADGSPVANAMGCSAHWFEEHPTFSSGGVVALGAYDHGVRFLHVDRNNGTVSERGWFLPHAGETSAAYWLDDRIVYAVDYARGIDVLRYNGKVR